MNLTDSQAEAVETQGVPCMINAGAGSGKTRVIVEKATRYLEQGVEPNRLLAITFTRKATAEMLERMFQRVGINAYKAVISNWHSFALNHIIKPAMKGNHPYLRKLGYTANEMVILDEAESITLINEAIKSLFGKDEYEIIKENGGARTVQDFMGKALSNGRGPKSEYTLQHGKLTAMNASQESFEHLNRNIIIWRAYNKRMIELNAVDYDTILVHAAAILEQDTKLRQWIQNHFQAVLADEHQDANPIQGKLLSYIVGEGKNLTLVGDEKQSIYAFRCADVTQLLNATKMFPNMQIVKMSDNFRSSKPIVDLANSIADLMDESQKVTDGHMVASAGIESGLPIAREFMSDSDEVEHTVSEIKSLIINGEYNPKEIAILYRSKAIKEPFEKALQEKSVEYSVVGDKNFLDSKEVKDWCSFLRFAANEKDVMAASRAIDGSHIKSTGVAMRNALIKDGISILEYLQRMSVKGTAKSAERKQGFSDLIECHGAIFESLHECGSMNDLAALNDHNLTEIELKALWGEVLVGLRSALEQIWEALYLPKVQSDALKKYKTTDMTVEVEQEIEKRRGNVNLLNDRLFKYTEVHGHLLDCIREIALLLDSGDDSVEGVQLMTEHASKGLEFKRVYVVGCEDEAHFRGAIDDNEHEELRLFYVAATRAEKELVISYAKRRFLHGEVKTRSPLRFVCNLPTHLLEWESFGSSSFNQGHQPQNERQGRYDPLGYGSYESQSYQQPCPGALKSTQPPATRKPAFQPPTSGNPIEMLRKGELPMPDMGVETKAIEVSGIKI